MKKQIKQLTQAEKRRIIAEQLRIAGQLSNRSLAAIIGCSPTTVGVVRRELADKYEQFGQQNTGSWAKHPYFLANKERLLSGLSKKSLIALRADGILDKMQEIDSLSPRYAQRLLHKERKAANKAVGVNISEDDVKIFQGDVRTGLVDDIADSSVQLCFLDMPYHRKAIEELTPHIAMTASRILSDGGSLLLMVGGSHLDKVLPLLTTADKTLHYQWDICYVCPRGTPLIQGRRVTTAVKHIIWMVKGKYTGPIQYDLIYAPEDPNGSDKAFYYHGQSVAGIKSILERWSSENDCICDFMCGGGSVAQAGLELGGRKLILSDINPDAVAITKQRVAEMFGANKGQMR